MEFDTLTVHAGREDFGSLGVHAPPLDLSSTYPLPDLDSGSAAFDALAAGAAEASSPVYGRLHNPTVHRLERALASLEHAEAAVAFASGMAALTAVLLAACGERRHVVGLRPLYGGSDHLLACGLLGLSVTWVDGVDGIPGALRPDTGLVVLETPQNPTLGVVDIAAAVAVSHDVPVLVDNTFATPVLQNPLDHGATLVLHSATKFLGGHGDVVAGCVMCDEAWATRLRQVRILTGAILHPVAAFLLHRSLPTLPFRVREAQERAGTLSRLLAEHPAVRAVRYPTPDGRQLRGPGAVLAFEVEGGLAAAAAVMRCVRLVTPAVSLGSTDTLIQHPAGLTHRLVDLDARDAAGITPALLRLSVGLEDVHDLWGDLRQALDVATSPTVSTAPPVAALASSL